MKSEQLSRTGLWVVLITSLYLLTSLYPEGLYQGAKLGPMSLAGWLPTGWVESRGLLDVCRLGFVVCAVFWLSESVFSVRVSSCLATSFFTLHMSLYVENIPFWDHQMNLANQLMILYCVAEYFKTEKGYPDWLLPMCRWAIGISYSLSGWAKISAEGWAWADGTSLQFWIIAIGYPQHWLAVEILDSLWLARNLQAAVLLLELLALPAMLWRPTRVICGLGLVLFHGVCLALFIYINFLGNAALLLAFTVLPQKAESQEANTT